MYEEVNHDEMLKVTGAMKVFGGSFVVALSDAMRRADQDNLRRLKDAFPEYWKQYKEMSETMATDTER